MFKLFWLKAKIYIIVAALLGVVIGTWKVRGWYEDGIVKDALIKQRDAYEEQAEIDAEILRVSLNNQNALRLAYRSLQNEANKISLCTNDGNDFLRLFNRGAVAANKKK